MVPKSKLDHKQAGVPEKGESPKMFDRIAHRYDLINRVLTMRLDVGWREYVGKQFPSQEGISVLDIATGTGDVLVMGLRRRKNVGLGVGVDVAPRMMRFGREKAERAGLGDRIRFVQGDALRLPFGEGSFEVVTISFGIRNVTDVPLALGEMYRVLSPGGRVLILEFSFPKNRVLRATYLLYLRHVLPKIGGYISGDAIPYHYLDKTVESFPYGEAFCTLMREAGFAEVSQKPRTFGIATVYSGLKK